MQSLKNTVVKMLPKARKLEWLIASFKRKLE